jgi:hypothetical protein
LYFAARGNRSETGGISEIMRILSKVALLPPPATLN